MKPFRNAGLRGNGDKAAKAQRTESAFQKERNRIRAANDEKTARLRALRLAKEAAERAEAEKNAAEGHTQTRDSKQKKSALTPEAAHSGDQVGEKEIS